MSRIPRTSADTVIAARTTVPVDVPDGDDPTVGDLDTPTES